MFCDLNQLPVAMNLANINLSLQILDSKTFLCAAFEFTFTLLWLKGIRAVETVLKRLPAKQMNRSTTMRRCEIIAIHNWARLAWFH